LLNIPVDLIVANVRLPQFATIKSPIDAVKFSNTIQLSPNCRPWNSQTTDLWTPTFVFYEEFKKTVSILYVTLWLHLLVMQFVAINTITDVCLLIRHV